MITRKKAKLIKRVSWTETLRSMEIGEFVEAELVDRINIVRHISRISKQENKKFSTEKADKYKLIVTRIE